MNRIIQKDHIGTLVLGCTELPLMIRQEMFSVPCLDAMEIHIAQLIALITGEKGYEKNR